MKLEDGYYPLTEELFERDALIFDENQIEEVWISHKDGTPYVGMKCEGFSNFGIWSVKRCPHSYVLNHGWEDVMMWDLREIFPKSRELIALRAVEHLKRVIRSL